METNKTVEGGIAVIILDGRLDTVTAPKFQPELLGAIEEHKNVTLDFSKVAYVSSAGLRVLLAGHKAAVAAGGKQVIKGASDDILEVFDLTGFLEIFDLES